MSQQGPKAAVETYHEIVDGTAAHTAKPTLHVRQSNMQILPHTLVGNLSRNNRVDQIVARDLHLGPLEDLVRCRHVLVENLRRDRRQRRVRNPGTVVPGLDLPQLVGAHAVHGLGVRGGIVLARNEGRHAAHCVDAAGVACADEELDVGVHEGDGHADVGAVGENEAGAVAEALDKGEDVVPSAAVEA